MSLLSLFICYNNIMDISGDILFYVPHTIGGGWDGGVFEFLPEGG